MERKMTRQSTGRHPRKSSHVFGYQEGAYAFSSDGVIAIPAALFMNKRLHLKTGILHNPN
jgi:hypothetical protein